MGSSAAILVMALVLGRLAAADGSFLPLSATPEAGWQSFVGPPAREAGASVRQDGGTIIVKSPARPLGDAMVQLIWPLQVEADAAYRLRFRLDSDRAGRLVIAYVLSVKPWTRYASVGVDVVPEKKEYECALAVKAGPDGKFDSPRSLRFFLGDFEGATVSVSQVAGAASSAPSAPSASRADPSPRPPAAQGDPAADGAFSPIAFSPESGWSVWMAPPAQAAGASIRMQPDALQIRTPAQKQADVNVQAIWPLSVAADRSYRLKFTAVTDRAGKLTIAYVLSVKPWTQYASASIDLVPERKEYECVLNVKRDPADPYDGPRSLRFFFGGIEAAAIAISGMSGTFFPPSEGRLQPAAIFTDRMVLQREIALPVWGRGRPDAGVSVAFAGQTRTTTVDKQGAWQVRLDPLKAMSRPSEMAITSGDEAVIVKDILVGEVWFCSGQSNMDVTLGGLKTMNQAETPNAREIQTADLPAIRQFEVVKSVSPKERKTSFRGAWEACSPRTAENFTAVGYYFAKELHARLDVPVGLIKCAYGGSPVEAWMSQELLQSTQHGRGRIAAWEQRQREYDPARVKAEYDAAMNRWKEAVAAGRPAPPKPWRLDPEPIRDYCYPATLYNAMLSPVVPYAMRGVIWYQGEGNTGGTKSYYETFPSLIGEWRKIWGQGDFPFYFVQLANFNATVEKPCENGWSLVRDAQLRTLALPQTGMAVTIDIGEEHDIHPHNKGDVGRRLALWALSRDYRQPVAECSGPLYKSVAFQGGKAVITFDHAGSGLTAGRRADVWKEPELAAGNPERFQVCGEDRAWTWAEAVITGKDTIEVSSAACAKPIAVRYAWMINPGIARLLYNKEGLPASPFRTDDF